MLAHLADVSIRSLLLAFTAAIVLWSLRGRQTAALQHAVWAAVVCGMLALFAFGPTLPRLPLRILERPDGVAPAALANRTLPDETPEFWQLPDHVPVTTPRSIDWIGVTAYAYGAIVFAFLARFVTGIWLVRKLLATASAARGDALRATVCESPVIEIPMTVGGLHPRILLPLEWRAWDRQKLEAVLAHEGAHVRRRDGLVAAVAAINRCIFWFHPLAWMLERKLALLAEQACDESCVASLGDRQRYAQHLLEMASVVDGSRGRLRHHALTMAAGSHLGRRIDWLLQEGRTFSRGLSWAGWAAVMACGIPLVWGAGAVDLDRQSPTLSLELPRWSVPAAPVFAQKPVLSAQVQAASVQATAPQALAPAPKPKFDVASVKPCAPGENGGKSGGRGGGGRFGTSPGRLDLTCMTVWDLIDLYVRNVYDPLINDGGLPFDAGRIRGGPGWVHSDRYTIDAKTDDPVASGPTEGRALPAQRMLMGPMLQALLEDRFQLKTHREVEEMPMYALTVAKSGLKLKPMEEGGCLPLDPTKGVKVSEMFPTGQKPLCVSHVGWDGPNWKLDAAGRSLSGFADVLSVTMDRHVIDKTGITALFNFHLVFAHDENTPGSFPAGLPSPFSDSDVPAGPSIFTVVEQLGLKLVPDKGPRGYIVIDSVQRPSEN